jgi:hypothetical protein
MLPMAMLFFKVIIIHLKVDSSQTNFQLFHYWFYVQGRQFRQCVIVMKHVPNDSQPSRFTDFNNCMKWSKFFRKDSDLPAKGVSIVCRNLAKAYHG